MKLIFYKKVLLCLTGGSTKPPERTLTGHLTLYFLIGLLRTVKHVEKLKFEMIKYSYCIYIYSSDVIFLFQRINYILLTFFLRKKPPSNF